MRTNRNDEWGYTRQIRRNPTELEQAVIEAQQLKSEYRALVGWEVAQDFIDLLPEDPRDAARMLLDELASYECTCGVTWISDPCQGCMKHARVDYVLDALVDF